MARRRHDFDEDDKVKALLWCERHCCLCGRFAGVGIEIAHIEKGKSDIDNALPLCFDCHAAVGHYNAQHPRGRKYTVRELKSRRDQIYEQHTRQLVSPVKYDVTQRDGAFELPRAGFHILNLGNTWPVRARVILDIVQGTRSFGPPRADQDPDAGATRPHYDGTLLWNLNPGFGATGHFLLPNAVMQDTKERVRVRVAVTLVDVHEREHRLLPVGYIHKLDDLKGDWYFESAEAELLPKPSL